MKKYLIDSSLILELFMVKSDLSIDIAKFIGDEDIDLYSSVFLKLEVSNVLTKKLDNLQLSQSIYDVFLSLPITFIDLDDNSLRQAQIIAGKYRTSVYDASYHALAIANSMILITLDERYYNSVKELGDVELFK